MAIDGPHVQYPSSVQNRYLAIFVGRHVSSKKLRFLPNHTFPRCKMDFIDRLLNNKTIILLNFAENRLILADKTIGQVIFCMILQGNC